MVFSTTESLVYLLPEVFLSASVVALLIIGLLRKGEDSVGFFYAAAIAVMTITLCLELFMNSDVVTQPLILCSGLIKSDAFSLFFKTLCISSALIFLVMAATSRETSGKSLRAMEYMLLVLASTLGMMLLCSSTNLMMLYLSLELLSLTSYILTGFIERDEKTSEAAIKYLLYGGIASGVMVYGMSLLYGLTGTLDYTQMKGILSGAASGPVFFIALVFVFAGVAYKIAVAPFHTWCPDVYEGSPTPFTGFLSVGPKAAGFAMAIRLFFNVYPVGDVTASAGADWTLILAIVSAVSMTLGNLAAMSQENVKRLLAYSSIAHAGYMLMPLATGTPAAVTSVFFYLVVYLMMNLGAFLTASVVYDEYHSDTIDGFDGLGWRGGRGALLASTMTIFLFSLTGIPPFAGFVGKVYLIMPLIKKGGILYVLAIVAVINTVLSLYYYARIVRRMFLSKGRAGMPEPGSGGLRLVQYSVLCVLAFFTVVIGIYWSPLDSIGNFAAGVF